MMRTVMVLGLVGVCSTAFAEPDPCASLQARVARPDPTGVARFELAVCRENHAQVATAFNLYFDVIARASTQLRDRAQLRATALAPRMSWLTIDAGVPAGSLELTLDDVRLDANTWNEMLPVDTGTHRIAVRTRGHVSWSTTVTVRRDGERVVVHVPALPSAAPRGTNRPCLTVY